MKVVSSFLKRFDPLLFVEQREGKLCVFRKGQRIESYDVDGNLIHFVRPDPYLVFALTEDWTSYSAPRDWGLEPIFKKLRECDIWARDIAKEAIESMEKSQKSRDRARDNHIESFLKDNRREFAKITNDIRTANMNTKLEIGD